MDRDQPSGRERVRVIVSGRVQGVAYRDGARRQARELGISGWFTNLPDGRVEGLFEGSPDAVAEMIRWCETGPRMAHVEDVTVERQPAEDDLRGFEVR